ncbi:MAG TPA: hypothetical protein VEA99_00280 [Gemmatimonadaceae bacterium]|nr:hypothetical protein [Gemmatimonadaceae bacterium]
MFLGHFAVALAARPASRRASLGWLVAATQLPDLLWPMLLLTGVERVRIAPGDTAMTPLAFTHYPWSHSLVMVAVAGLALGGLHLALRRDVRDAALLALLVVSHWLLDALTHRPDLPLVPGGETLVGLGLWNSVPLTLAVELALFAAGVALYARFVRARGERLHAGTVGFLVLLLAIHAGNVFGPPPPAVRAIAIAGLAMWLLVAWAARADRRVARASTT